MAPASILLCSFVNSTTLNSRPLLEFNVIVKIKATDIVVHSFSSSGSKSDVLNTMEDSTLLAKTLFISKAILPDFTDKAIFSIVFPKLSAPSIPVSDRSYHACRSWWT